MPLVAIKAKSVEVNVLPVPLNVELFNERSGTKKWATVKVEKKVAKFSSYTEQV